MCKCEKPDRWFWIKIIGMTETLHFSSHMCAEKAKFDSMSFGAQDVVFSVANAKAMIFVGGGARDWGEWALFLGLVRFSDCV